MVKTKGMWVHPWDLADIGIEKRQDWREPNILFHNPRRLAYTSEENAFYWDIDKERFNELPEELMPRVSEEVGPVVGEYVEACKRYGLICVIWLLVLRNEKAVYMNPKLGAVDVSGSLADYKRLFMCPSNPVVRKFIGLMVEWTPKRILFEIKKILNSIRKQSS